MILGSVFIEPELIKRVTVDKGAHDASVGNGGFGGSVRLDTKDASDFLKPDQNIGLFTKYSYHTNNHQNNYTAAFLAKSPNDMLVRYSPMSRPNYYKIKIELG